MHSIATALIALAVGSIAAVLPRQSDAQWQITEFSVSSLEDSPTLYYLKISGEGETDVLCATTNKYSVMSSTCPDSEEIYPFNNTACSPQDDTGFSWQFSITDSPLQGGGKDFFVQFNYNKTGETPLIGCSPLIPVNDTTCTQGENNDYRLNVPPAFNVTPSTMTQCIYA